MKNVDLSEATVDRPMPTILSNSCVVMVNDDHDLAALAQALAVEGEYDGNDFSFPAVAQYYESTPRSRQKLISRLKDWIAEQPGSQDCDRLAALPVSKFVSLSHCSHLEDALRNAGRETRCIVKNSDVPYGRANQTIVVKPFGTLERPESLVLTEHDYYDFPEMASKRNLVRYLRHWLASHIVIIVGCNPSDDKFCTILEDLLDGISSLDRQCFALVNPGSPALIEAAWSSLGICPLALPITSLKSLFIEPPAETEPSEDSRLANWISGTFEKQPVQFSQQPRSNRHMADRQPYRFLDYYDEQDSDLFFGRLTDVNALSTLIRNDSLTALCGRSGVGKTSLIRAGVMPDLRKKGYLPLCVRVGDDPGRAIRLGAWLALPRDQRERIDQSLPLSLFLNQVVQAHGGPVVIFVDQFEECFTRLTEKTRTDLAMDLRSCLRQERNDLKFVLSLREDFLAELHTLSTHLPTILRSERLYRLKALNPDQACRAIVEPARLYQREMEPALVERLLYDLNTSKGIQPAQLSIVCDRLYRSLNKNEAAITLEHYQNLGTASRILAGYVDYVLESFTPAEREQAVTILKNMVTHWQTKAVLTRSEVLDKIGAGGDDILARLVERRLIRTFEEQEQPRYELAHDYLVERIQGWASTEEEQAQAVVDMVRGELRSWRNFGHLIDSARLAHVYAERENPALVLTDEELALLSLSASRQAVDAEPWIARLRALGDQVEGAMTLLEAAATGGDRKVRRACAEILVHIGSPSLELLVKSLSHEEVDVREMAAHALARMEWSPPCDEVRAAWWLAMGMEGKCVEIGSPAVEPLVERLGDKEPSVRQAAAEALGQIGDIRAVEPLVERLADTNDWVRRVAAKALGQIEDARASERLVEQLGDESEEVRRAAAMALGQIGTPAVKLLVERLGDKDTLVRAGAAEALGQIGDASAVEPLMERLSDEHGLVRAKAARVLGQIADTRAIEPLVNRLGDNYAEVRVTAAEALVHLGPQSVEPLVKRLGDRDERVRQRVAEVLGRLGDTHSVEPLVERLYDGYAMVRRAAAEALGQIGDPRAVEPLLGRQDDRAEWVRQAAAEALGKIGDPRAVEPLVKWLGDEFGGVRTRAAGAMGKIGDPRAVEPLVERLGDKDELVRAAAAEALGKIEDARAVEPLLRQMGDRDEWFRGVAARALEWHRKDDSLSEQMLARLANRDEWVRGIAARALGQIGDVRAVEPLVKQLDDKDEWIRWAAAEALGQIGDLHAIRPLVERLGDEESWVRQAAADALARMGWSPPQDEIGAAYWSARGEGGKRVEAGTPIVEMLARRLVNRSRDVRRAAAKALGQIGDARATQPLMERLGDRDWEVGKLAAEALGQIGNAQEVEPLMERLTNRSREVERAAEALGQIGDARAVEPLAERLEDKAEWVRLKAAEALGQIGDPRAVEPLVERLGDRSWRVRWNVAEALGQIGDSRAVEPLVERLDDKNELVRRAAAEALGRIGDIRPVEPLVERLDDKNELVRRAAAEALGRIGDVRAVEPLIERLRDEVEAVRAEAAEALGRIGDARAVEPLVERLGESSWWVRQQAAEALTSIGWSPPAN